MPLGQWQGPVESAYGVHLVFVSERTEGRVPALADVRDAVRREWDDARRLEANEKFYRELLKHYTVTIENPEPAKQQIAASEGEMKRALLMSGSARHAWLRPCSRTRCVPRISNCARPGRKLTTRCGKCLARETCASDSTWNLPAGCTNVTEPRGSMANNAYTERWTVKCPGGLSGGTIHIAGLSATVVDVLVRLERLDGTTQVTRLTPSSPSFVVAAAANAVGVARTYTVLGVEHILSGIDHLLFVLALIIITRGGWKLVKTVTAFTVSHSITLTLATLGYVHIPQRPVEAVIALSIVFVAAEILRGRQRPSGPHRPCAVDRGLPVRTDARPGFCQRAQGRRSCRTDISPRRCCSSASGLKRDISFSSASSCRFSHSCSGPLQDSRPSTSNESAVLWSLCRPTPSAAWRCSGSFNG